MEETLIHHNLIKPKASSIKLLIHLIFERINPIGTKYPSHHRVAQILELIKRTPPEQLSIERLASLVCISPSRLRMQFKRVAGVPLHQYLIKQKILSAITAIINGSSIQEAAYSSGFNDGSHLTKLMQKVFAINPSMFIKVNSSFSVTRDDHYFDLITKSPLS